MGLISDARHMADEIDKTAGRYTPNSVAELLRRMATAVDEMERGAAHRGVYEAKLKDENERLRAALEEIKRGTYQTLDPEDGLVDAWHDADDLRAIAARALSPSTAELVAQAYGADPSNCSESPNSSQPSGSEVPK